MGFLFYCLPSLFEVKNVHRSMSNLDLSLCLHNSTLWKSLSKRMKARKSDPDWPSSEWKKKIIAHGMRACIADDTTKQFLSWILFRMKNCYFLLLYLVGLSIQTAFMFITNKPSLGYNLTDKMKIFGMQALTTDNISNLYLFHSEC